MVLALSNESEDLVSNYVEEMGISVRTAAGFSTGDDWGVRSYPSAALIDTSGKIVWTGHPSEVSGSKVKSALKGAKGGGGGFLSFSVSRELNPKLKKAADLALDGKLGKALAAARKLADDAKADPAAREDAEVFAGEILGFGELLMGQSEALIERRSMVKGLDVLETLGKEFKGTELGATLTKRLGEIAGDEELQLELAADQAWQKAMEAVEKRGLKKAAGKFEGIVKKYPGSKAAERAKMKLRKI